MLACRPEAEIGHASSMIGIYLLGGYGSAETDPFTANCTKQWDITLRQMIDAIGTRTVIDRVSGHRQYAANACLVFNVTK